MSPPREKTPKLHPNRSNSGGPHRGPLEWSHVEPAESPSPQNIDGNRSADPIAVKHPDQIVHPCHGNAIGTHDGVEAHQPGKSCWSVRLKPRNHRSGRILDFGDTRVTSWHRRCLCRHSDVRAPNAAMLDELAEHELRCVTCDGKTDALRAHDYGSVDADHFATR